MLFIFVVQTDAAPSCRLLCCCLRLWDGSGGAAVKSAAETVAGLPLLIARCFFLFFVIFLFAALPYIPTSLLNFRSVACTIRFTSSANAPNKIMMERKFTFFSGCNFFFPPPSPTLYFHIFTADSTRTLHEYVGAPTGSSFEAKRCRQACRQSLVCVDDVVLRAGIVVSQAVRTS